MVTGILFVIIVLLFAVGIIFLPRFIERLINNHQIKKRRRRVEAELEEYEANINSAKQAELSWLAAAEVERSLKNFITEVQGCIPGLPVITTKIETAGSVHQVIVAIAWVNLKYKIEFYPTRQIWTDGPEYHIPYAELLFIRGVKSENEVFGSRLVYDLVNNPDDDDQQSEQERLQKICFDAQQSLRTLIVETFVPKPFVSGSLAEA